MKYNQKIKEILKAREITQDTLAREIGVTFVALNRWINSEVKPRVSNASKIDEIYTDLFVSYNDTKINKDKNKNKDKLINNFLKNEKEKIIKDCYELNIKKLLQRPDFVENLNIKLTYSTNKIEGSTMTESEVRDVLYENLSFSHRSVIEHLEAKNHETALMYILDNYSHKIDIEFILKLHSILMNSIRSDAGIYRDRGVRIVGSFVPTANHMSIDKRMKELITFINNKKPDIFNFLAKVHADFEMIHPFSDGNGRIGRLILIHLCLQNGLLPIVILSEYRTKYIKSLQKAQLDNDYYALEQVLIDGVKVSLAWV